MKKKWEQILINLYNLLKYKLRVVFEKIEGNFEQKFKGNLKNCSENFCNE